jgi:hypothetical protein
MSGTSYWRAQDVEDVAEKLIAETHTDLAGVPIKYMFRDKAQRVRGRVELGLSRRVTGANAALVGLVGRDKPEIDEFFVVIIAYDTWTGLNAKQRAALVDHQLSYFTIEQPEDTDKGARMGIVAPDVEEFTAVVERHGSWRPSIEFFARQAKQIPGQTSLDEAD